MCVCVCVCVCVLQHRHNGINHNKLSQLCVIKYLCVYCGLRFFIAFIQRQFNSFIKHRAKAVATQTASLQRVSPSRSKNKYCTMSRLGRDILRYINSRQLYCAWLSTVLGPLKKASWPSLCFSDGIRARSWPLRARTRHRPSAGTSEGKSNDDRSAASWSGLRDYVLRSHKR